MEGIVVNHKRSINLEIRRLATKIRREFEHGPNSSYIDSVTGANGWIIGYLACNKDKDIFQKDVEEEFSIRRSTVSKVVGLMEQKGLIMREPVSYDARLKKLVLTQKAWELHKIAIEDSKCVEECLIQGLSEEEIEQLYVLLEKMSHNLKEKNKSNKC